MISPRSFLTTLLIAAVAPTIAHANPAARPGDEALTCAQIGAEMMPSAMMLAGAFGGMSGSIAELEQRAAEGQAEFAERQAFAAACLAANTATQVATLGMANNPACEAGQAAYDARDAARAPKIAADSARIGEEIDDTMADVNAVAGTLDMARMEHLAALAEAKGCSEQ